MARYIGPKTKIARKFGEPVYGPDKYFEKKKYPPGQHGNEQRRKKLSEYGTQLKEKQKAKYTYGVLERQFRKTFQKATKHQGVTGVVLLQLLESRLDNVIFRMGMAPTRDAARQLVSHRHVTVNGEILNIPSYKVKPDDIVGIRERSKSLEIVQDAMAKRSNKYSWLEWDDDQVAGKFLNYPEREDIPENINEQLIVELYSK
ncbi:MAG: 30S ribosomal protein S4 [Bacteroidales bacterium]|nr:30S ribosomal protein S4 [Bacteroidales bacterium]MCF8327144.1 30S ribosomal protein S4 [Bacteroidales bacterium]